jgi:hypothetical protein
MRLLLVIAGLLAGPPLAWLGLVRLGWRRHGDGGLGFLHPEVLLHPDVPWWGAHVANLALLGAGVALTLGAAVYLAIRRRAPRR